LKEIPAFLVDIENLNCPYLFKFLSDEEFKAFIENIKSSVNPQSSGTIMESIENRIDQGQKVLNSLTENMESLTKQPSIYLQLLCGWTFEPVVTHKIDMNKYSEKVENAAQFGAAVYSIAIKTSILWNTVATVVTAVGYAIPKLNEEQLKKTKILLKYINNPYQVEEFQGKKYLNLAELDSFHSLIKKLEEKNKIRQYQNKIGKKNLKGYKFTNCMVKEVVKCKDGKR